ncbi:hypothetical protein M0R45_013038 [Rubus argutus]|uniref:Uncharacterized protein n=1 Tax=Rubus argutus TaxID=59490 RepID=A0AAW1XH10_RUBAR
MEDHNNLQASLQEFSTALDLKEVDKRTTALTAITQLVHHGMLFVPIGYTFGAGMFEMEQIKGGSPYGAGTYAGDGHKTAF